MRQLLELLIVVVIGDDVQLEDVADGAERVVATPVRWPMSALATASTVMVQSRLMSPASCVSLSSLQNYENSYVVLPQDLQPAGCRTPPPPWRCTVLQHRRRRGGAQYSSTAAAVTTSSRRRRSIAGELWLAS
jgi:hypothetical protein